MLSANTFSINVSLKILISAEPFTRQYNSILVIFIQQIKYYPKHSISNCKNIMRKGANAGDQNFLLFPKCFSKIFSSATSMFSEELPLSHTSPGFYVSAVNLLKTLGEKEKLLVVSNISFSHSVFHLFGELSAIFIKYIIVVCKSLSVLKSLKFDAWEKVTIQNAPLTLSQTSPGFYVSAV